MHNIEKRFGPITALSHANFELKKGSVVALVGANGAGKSTLMNVLGGITTQDNGQILINDEKVDFNSPGDAASYGIQFVHQELSIFKTMTVAENIFINKFPSKYGLISKHMMETTATLSTGDCQMVVIARAMLGSPKILILDEPTSSLSKYEKEKLNDVIRRLKTSGVAIIYISHFINEIFEVCDSVTVMRNGETISSQTINETDNATIIELMLGDVASIEKKRKQEKNETIFLSVDNLQNENKVQEAEAKWSKIKNENKNLKLHMIGKLQSNKAKKAVEIFDYIHSVDSQKLADVLSKSQNAIKKNINYFIQVNIGNEEQKSGIPFAEVDGFFNYCTKEKKMQILGLMAIPPNNENVEKYFKNLSELNFSLGLKELSLGMSSDYITAIKYKSTYLRLGSSIFGERT